MLREKRTHDAITETAGAAWVSPKFDAAGNMIQLPKPGAETTRLKGVYDAWNRLVKVTDNSDVTLAEYRCDGLSRLKSGRFEQPRRNEWPAKRLGRRTARTARFVAVARVSQHQPNPSIE